MGFQKLPAYLSERFPPINMALFAILYLTVLSCAQYFGGLGLNFYPIDLLGIAATISFFFRLRVFDEIKDYDIDTRFHPQRILQSGLIQLRDLKLLAAVLFIAEVIWSCYMGITTVALLLGVLAYSLLMRYEFFVPTFLKNRLLLYAFSHMLIMPMVICWLWSAWAATFEWTRPLVLLMASSLLGGFAFELARKIHAPGSEVPGQDSYSQSLGYPGAITSVLLVLLTGVATQFYLLWLMDAAIWSFGIISLLLIAAMTLYFICIQSPDQKRLRKAEKIVSLFMLFSYLTIIIESL